MRNFDIDRKLDKLDQAKAEIRDIFEGNVRTRLLDMGCISTATQRHFVWLFAFDEIGLSHGQIARIYAASRTTIRSAINLMKTKISNEQRLADNYSIVRERLLSVMRK